MFDIGFIEIVVICLVGLVVIGPSRLPEALRTGAMWLGRGKRMIGNVRRDLENEIGIDEIRRDLRNEQIMSEIKAENLEEERERQQKAQEQAQEQAQGDNNSRATPPAPSKPKTHTNSYLDSANQNGKPSEPPHSESESLADTDSQASQSAEHKNN